MFRLGLAGERWAVRPLNTTPIVSWIVRITQRPYVVAVFPMLESARAYLTTLPGNVQANSRFHSREDVELPCIAIETRAHFAFMNESEAARQLLELRPNDDGELGATVYRFDGEFTPKVPGRDEMGRLLHWHVHASDLSGILERGISALWTWKENGSAAV